jgi:hypothetical protein
MQIQTKIFHSKKLDARSFDVAVESLNAWLAGQSGITVINVETVQDVRTTIDGRYVTTEVEGVRVWYTKVRVAQGINEKGSWKW